VYFDKPGYSAMAASWNQNQNVVAPASQWPASASAARGPAPASSGPSVLYDTQVYKTPTSPAKRATLHSKQSPAPGQTNTTDNASAKTENREEQTNLTPLSWNNISRRDGTWGQFPTDTQNFYFNKPG